MNQILDRYAVIDIETTGFSAKDHIIEIGAAIVDNSKVEDSFRAFVKPASPIPQHITALTGITNDMVADADPVDTVIPALLKFIGDLPIVGHNVGFDLGFVRRACQDLALECLLTKGADTLHMSRERFPHEKNHNLFTIAERLEAYPETEHRALADVYTTIACYEKLKTIPVSKDSYYHIHFSNHLPDPDSLRMGNWIRKKTTDLSGMKICVTGALEFFTRESILEKIEKQNGKAVNKVSKKLTYLVVAPFYDPNAAEKSNKIKAAEEFIAEGQPIQIISEAQFMELLGFVKITDE